MKKIRKSISKSAIKKSRLA